MMRLASNLRSKLRDFRNVRAALRLFMYVIGMIVANYCQLAVAWLGRWRGRRLPVWARLPVCAHFD